MPVSRAARFMSGLTIILVPTIAYGGYFLLTQLSTNEGSYMENELRRSFYRAGHAHAGVLVLLSLIGQVLADATRLPMVLQWSVRIGLFTAPMLISGGFFGAAPTTPTASPTPLIALIYVGIAILVTSLLILGVGLIRPPAQSAPQTRR